MAESVDKLGRGDYSRSVNKGAGYRRNIPEAWSNRLIKPKERKSFAFGDGNKYSARLVHGVWSRAVVCFREQGWDPWLKIPNSLSTMVNLKIVLKPYQSDKAIFFCQSVKEAED